MIEFLPWDSDFFGYKIGRLLLIPPLYSQLSGLLTLARREGYRLIYLVVPDPPSLGPAAMEELQALLGHYGLELMHDKGIIDLKVENPPNTLPPGISEWEGTGDLERLRELNLLVGQYSRFRRDPGFVQGEYERLYTHWLEEGLVLKPENKVYLFKDKGQIVGFLTLSRRKDHVSMDLMAIDPKWRRQGIAQDLVEAARYWTGQCKLDRIRGTIQRDNIPAINLYRKIGFQVISPEFVYHCWLDKDSKVNS
jgi:dTDP-4-amino-4,6-dideoxy-D-galactose acyltransferase